MGSRGYEGVSVCRDGLEDDRIVRPRMLGGMEQMLQQRRMQELSCPIKPKANVIQAPRAVQREEVVFLGDLNQEDILVKSNELKGRREEERERRRQEKIASGERSGKPRRRKQEVFEGVGTNENVEEEEGHRRRHHRDANEEEGHRRRRHRDANEEEGHRRRHHRDANEDGSRSERSRRRRSRRGDEETLAETCLFQRETQDSPLDLGQIHDGESGHGEEDVERLESIAEDIGDAMGPESTEAPEHEVDSSAGSAEFHSVDLVVEAMETGTTEEAPEHEVASSAGSAEFHSVDLVVEAMGLDLTEAAEQEGVENDEDDRAHSVNHVEEAMGLHLTESAEQGVENDEDDRAHSVNHVEEAMGLDLTEAAEQEGVENDEDDRAHSVNHVEEAEGPEGMEASEHQAPQEPPAPVVATEESWWQWLAREYCCCRKW